MAQANQGLSSSLEVPHIQPISPSKTTFKAQEKPSSQRPVPAPIQTGIKDDYPDIPDAESPTNIPSSAKGYHHGGGGRYEYDPVTGEGTYRVNPFDEIIPHPDEVHHRNLVLCFDGTGDQFDADVSALLVGLGWGADSVWGCRIRIS